MKPNLEPLEMIHQFPDCEHISTFRLHFNRSYYDKDIEKLKGDILLESSCIIEFEDYVKEIPDNDHSSKQIFIEQLVKINKIIDIIRYSHNLQYPNVKLILRNIGVRDFLFRRIDVNGKNMSKSFNTTYTKDNPYVYKIDKIEQNVPFEWATFSKSIDLLDFGFYNESLIIAFNLLDYCIQKTIKSLMVNLKSEKEKDELLRQIKEQRIKTYLGPLFKTLTGSTIFDSNLTLKDIEKINKLRNDVVHSGKDCNYENVKQSLKTIYKAIKALSSKGSQNFKIPDGIIFN